MQTFAKLALAAGVSALGLGAAVPAQAADMAYPEAQAAQATRRRRPAITRRRRHSRATIHRLRRPPRMGIRRRRRSNTAPTSRRRTSLRPDHITCRGLTGAATGRTMPMATGTGAAIGAGEVRDRRTGYSVAIADPSWPGHVREDGAARLMPGHDARRAFANLCLQILQCAIDCWPKSPRRRFAAKDFKIKKHFDFRCLRGCGESIRRSRLTFISITTNCATVSLNKGAF